MAKNPSQEKADDTARSRGDNLAPLHPSGLRREQEPAVGPTQLEAVFEGIDQGLIIADPAGHVLRMNRRALELHGFASAGEALQTPVEFPGLFELVELDGTPLAGDDCLTRGGAIRHRALRVRDKRTGRQWIGSYDGSPVRDTNGRTIYIVLTVRDVTESRQTESRPRPIHDIAEQNRAEELRSRTEQRLCGFFESGGVYMALLETMDDDVICALANGKVAEFFDRPLEQVTGATGRELGLSEEVISHWLSLLGQCRQSGQPTSVEFCLRPDGRDQWFSGTVTSLGVGDAGRAQFVLVATDATERRQAEQALRESEALYRMLATKLPGGAAFILDRDLRYIVAEGQALETAGFTPEDFEGKTIWEALDPVAADRYEEVFRRALEGGRFRWEHESHGRQYVSEGVPIRDAQGRVTHVLAVSFDITDRKRMEHELRQLNQRLEEEVQAQTQELQEVVDRLRDEVDQRALAEDRLRKRSQMLDAFFRHSATPLAFLDGKFNFVRVNQAYAGAHGAVAGEFTDRNYFEMHPHEDTREIFEHVVRTGEPYRAFARPVIDPADPQHVTFWDWQIQPLKDDEGQVELLVFNLQDVTAQQAAMHELRRRTAQLQRLALELTQAEDRERKQLAELLHDDLQQQLAAAKFHLGLLSSRTKDDAGLQEIADQLASLLRDAIDKSRTLSHELSPAVLHQHDVGEIFEWVGRQFQTRHGLTVHVEVRGQVQSQSEPLKAFLLRSAQEILFNTIKHAHVGQARLRVQRRRGSIWLSIGDRGGGFDPNQIGITGGYGLMSIRERAELLGGRMRIRSAPGRGSTFVITMPDVEVVDLAEEQAEPPSDTPKKRRGRRRKGKRIAGGPIHVLLVDDHKIMRDGLANLLSEESDIEIVGHAANGSEAIERARELMPDVIIMDVAMPVMAGDEATRHIRREMPHARIVALSMFEEPGLAQMMKEAGADAYLAKSGPFRDLIAAVRGELPE